MGFVYGWAVKGSVGLSCFVGTSCLHFSLDKTHGSQLIVWSDLTKGSMPDFAIHSHGIQTKTKNNQPVVLSRK